MTNLPLKNLVLAAMFAALTAVLSQISIPLPFTPVPLNLATLSVFLAGGLLGARYSLFSQLIYIFLGLFGLPVFAQLSGGPGILFGPTGGYIIGYALSAWSIGLLFGKYSQEGHSSSAGKIRCMPEKRTCVLFFVVGALAYYVPGTLWFMWTTGNGIIPSLTMCVLPFLPGDALKIAAAVLLTRRLKPQLRHL